MFKFLKLTFGLQQLLAVLITLTLGRQKTFIGYQKSNGQIAEQSIEDVRTDSNSILLLCEAAYQLQNSSPTCSKSKIRRTTGHSLQHGMTGPSSTMSWKCEGDFETVCCGCQYVIRLLCIRVSWSTKTCSISSMRLWDLPYADD